MNFAELYENLCHDFPPRHEDASIVPQHVDVAESKEGKKSNDIATLHFAEP